MVLNRCEMTALRSHSVLGVFLALFFVCVSAKSQCAVSSYIEKYAPLAFGIEYEYGIPASITLAQAILESSVGNSRLARTYNNHFGISTADGYKRYVSVEESYADYAVIVSSLERYKSLFEIDISDYKGWAHGLQKCGYASDSLYAKKLIRIIERHKLYELLGGIFFSYIILEGRHVVKHASLFVKNPWYEHKGDNQRE